MSDAPSHRRAAPPRRSAGQQYLHADGVLRDRPEAAAPPAEPAPVDRPARGAARAVKET